MAAGSMKINVPRFEQGPPGSDSMQRSPGGAWVMWEDVCENVERFCGAVNEIRTYVRRDLANLAGVLSKLQGDCAGLGHAYNAVALLRESMATAPEPSEEIEHLRTMLACAKATLEDDTAALTQQIMAKDGRIAELEMEKGS